MALKLADIRDEKLQDIVAAAEKALDESLYTAVKKATVLFDARGKVLIAAAERPPLGTDPRDPALAQNISQFIVEPGRLVIAGAAHRVQSLEPENIKNWQPQNMAFHLKSVSLINSIDDRFNFM